MKKLTIFLLIGIVVLAGIGIAQVAGTPPNIPNGFNLNVPPLPTVSGQQINDFCDYTGNLQIEDIQVWENYAVSIGQFRVEYSFKIRQPKCVIGFVGNVSYTSLDNPVAKIQEDFENQILNSIAVPPSAQTPLASGNSVGGTP